MPRRQGSDSRAFFAELLQRLETSPAVEVAGLTQALPLKSFGFGSNFPAEGKPSSYRLVYWRIVSPRYFDALGIRLVEGRAPSRTSRTRWRRGCWRQRHGHRLPDGIDRLRVAAACPDRELRSIRAE